MADKKESFTQVAHVAQSQTPKNISATEGWLLLIQALGCAILLAVSFQSHTLKWGGTISLLTQGAFFILLLTVSSRFAITRRIHPLGYKRRLIFAGLLPVFVAAIGGWFWVAPPTHEASWVLTTAVAVLSCIPSAAVGLDLVRRGNR